MKLIAVTQRVVVDPTTGERRDALDQRWVKFLFACGLTPIPVPNAVEPTVRLLDELPFAGVLLTGGDDLAAYGGTTPERDATEDILLRWVQETTITPLLGVCRGMQCVQQRFGVRLQRVDRHVAVRHRVRFEGADREVNSYHHFAALGSAPEVEVLASAPDGAIEAVRHRCLPIAGVMWHPEREMPFDSQDVAFFQRFFIPSGVSE